MKTTSANTENWRPPEQALCPVDRGTAWRRQSSDEAMEPFWRLELDDDEDGGS